MLYRLDTLVLVLGSDAPVSRISCIELLDRAVSHAVDLNEGRVVRTAETIVA